KSLPRAAVTDSWEACAPAGRDWPGGRATPADRGWSGLLDGRDLDGDLDLVAHEHAAGLEGRVPREAEVLAGDRRRRRERGAEVAVGVGRGAVELGREGNGLGHAVDRELTGHLGLGGADRHGGGREGPRGVGLDLEEVGGLEVAVAARVARVDGRGVE